QQTLKDEIEKTLSTLQILYGSKKSESKFTEAFKKLLSLAQVGLVGEHPDTSVASAALLSLHNEIVDREAAKIKNDYMIKLGAWALAFGGISIVAHLLTTSFGYTNVFILWAGCMAGAWASFASRRVVLGFFDLVRLEEDQIEPPLRLIFAGV